MANLFSLLGLAATGAAFHIPVHRPPYGGSVNVPAKAPADAGVPMESFVSYSIEFSSFPDYAGNKTNPNTFSNNLLNNIGVYQGSKPYLRVGGNTQDFGRPATLHLFEINKTGR